MYRPIFRWQHPDPTTSLDWFNCTMTSGAMALDFHTLGKTQVWGGQLRSASGDTSGGTDLGDLKVAWSHYGSTLIDQRGFGWNQLIADLKSGRGVVVQGDYDVLTGADSEQPSFNGDHAMYVNPEFFMDGTCVLVGDPLAGTWKVMRLSVLRAYMSKLGKRAYGDADKLFFACTAPHRDTSAPASIGSKPAGVTMWVEATKAARLFKTTGLIRKVLRPVISGNGSFTFTAWAGENESRDWAAGTNAPVQPVKMVFRKVMSGPHKGLFIRVSDANYDYHHL